MPLIAHSTYTHPFILRGGHIQTILPSYRKVENFSYDYERIETPDNDFLDLAWRTQNSRKLMIATHGLEGNSERPYMRGIAKAFFEAGYDVLAWNCRSCSGEMNKQFRLYNHGDIDDIDCVVQHALQKNGYDTIILIGFSMGGNISLKYAAEKAPPSVSRVIAFSAPLEMRTSTAVLDKKSNILYKKLFISGIKPKILEKIARFPDRITMEMFKKIKKWDDYLDFFFVKINGYASLDAFFELGSAVNFLHKIKIPTLIVQAQNDPMLTADCFPYKLCESLKYVFLETPKNGGHCGFPLTKSRSWAEARALNFAEIDNFL